MSNVLNVYTGRGKNQYANATFDIRPDGYLHVIFKNEEDPREIVAVFVPGYWKHVEEVSS